MKVRCPHCGEEVTVSGLGRKRLNIPLNIILDAVKAHRSIGAAAQQLHCSQGYIFNALKANGLKLKDVISDKGLATKDTRLLHKGVTGDGRHE